MKTGTEFESIGDKGNTTVFMKYSGNSIRCPVQFTANSGENLLGVG